MDLNKNIGHIFRTHQLPPPIKNETDFEKFTCSLFNSIYKTKSFDLYARKGQSQYGNDIFSIAHGIGIQCKLKQIDREKATQEIIKDLKEELPPFIKKFTNAPYFLKRFILASTHKGDGKIQDECAKLNLEYGIEVEYWSWEKLSMEMTYEVFIDFYQNLIELASRIKQEPEIVDFNQLSSNIEIPSTYILRKFIPLTTELKSPSPFHFYEDNKIDVEELLKNSNRTIILGDAGSGKTVEIGRILNFVTENAPHLITLKINLRNYLLKDGIDGLLPKKINNISDENCFFLFDGLDEIHSDILNDAIKDLNNFSRRFPKSFILISCRTNFYDISANTLSGPLEVYKSYKICDISYKEAKDYYNQKFNCSAGEYFISNVMEADLDDFIKKPFFLEIISNHYRNNSNLEISKAELIKEFIQSSFKFDAKKFESTETLPTKKNQLLKTLKKVAFTMQLLGKNYLTNDEFHELLSESEANLIRYSSALEKESSYSEKWTFNHNNIQEYLVALILSELTFIEIIDLITISGTENIVNQNWLNVLSFFTSLDDNSGVQTKFFEWISKNQSDLIIKFEDERISKELRNKVFQSIFNDYKRPDIWIRSNKFTVEELAKFGSTRENLEFILKEINNENSSKNNLINSISILQYFNINSAHLDREVILNHLLKILENNRDPDIIYSILNTFKNNQLYLEDTLDKTHNLIKDRDNEYIRSAMYSLIESQGNCNDFIGYLLEGFYERDNNSEDRGAIRFANENFNLRNCLSKIDEPKALDKFCHFIINSEIRRNINYSKYIESLLKNCQKSFFEDEGVFNSVYRLFIHTLLEYQYELQPYFKVFFIETETQLRVFTRILQEDEEIKPQHLSQVFATIFNDEISLQIIDRYNKKELKDGLLEFLYFDLKCEPLKQKLFRKEIEEKTSFSFPNYPQTVDHEKLRKKKIQKDINLLLNQEELKKEVLNFFKEEQIDEIEYDLFFDIINSEKRWQEESEYFSGATLRLIQDSVNHRKKITKKGILEWFQNDKDFTFYCYYQLYQILIREKDISFTEESKVQIYEWINSWIPKVDFRNNSKTYSYVEEVIYFFTGYFHIVHPKHVLLNMLSVKIHYDESISNTYEFILNELDTDLITNRMFNNLKSEIALSTTAFEEHIKSLTRNSHKKSYPLITAHFLKEDLDKHIKFNLMELFFKNTKDIESWKKILNVKYADIFWQVAKDLINENELTLVNEYVKNNLIKVSKLDKIKTCQLLLETQDILGLEFLQELITTDNIKTFDALFGKSITKFQDIKGVDELFKIFHLSFKEKIPVDHFEQLYNYVLNCIMGIAKLNQSNYLDILKKFEQQIIELEKIDDNAKYLRYKLEGYKNEFYLNKSKQISIEEAIKLIETVIA
ncbi:hypothetical protein C9994_08270 [Marivirga lumbricoides]|uniref:Uncharacterized protein n=1 Tax=Marivirga lumbricoides TaxID=1046115 RepID=A0A2T4DR20_9BACT|nr:hypothetical protein C9994_08270 [Marivirga lumbricoides]